jgi:hypothetical protein
MELPNNISQIAALIANDWKKINYAAKPYLEAMFYLNSKSDMYLHDSATSIVLYFLCNAGSYRGPLAKQLKAKLKEIVKN